MTEPGRERRSGVPWWTPLLALALLCGGVAAAAASSSRDGGETHAVLGARVTRTHAATTAETATTTAAATAERSLLGRTAGRYVRARSVRVLDVVGDRIFWVVRRDGSRALVHLQGRGTRWAIRRGQLLTFTGVVTKNRARSAGAWGLEASEGRARFERAGFHLEVFGPRIRFLR